jgi:hypothetical protein
MYCSLICCIFVLILRGRPLLCKRNKADKCFMTKFSSKSLNFHLQNSRNFATTFHLISDTWFVTKFRGISWNYWFEISRNAFLRNFAKYFSEIPRINCTKFHKMLFYEISRNIYRNSEKFREIIGTKFREVSRNKFLFRIKFRNQKKSTFVSNLHRISAVFSPDSCSSANHSF